MDCLVVGCGLCGAVIARHMAERGKRAVIWERRDHIGGNLYDYVDEHGFLVQKYGPHTFHTPKRALYDYMCRFEQWQDYQLTCGAEWGGKYTPTPFNFTTIDTFYPPTEAERLKEKLKKEFAGRETATVVEVLEHPDPEVRGYAEFLFRNDYAPYTAKQWGVPPEQIDPSVLKRVPLRFSYGEGYFDDPYQAMPVHSFTRFFENLLNHPNIEVKLGIEALEHLKAEDGKLLLDGKEATFPVVYTGALDELFGGIYGALPYRSLRFEWRYEEKDSLQPAPVVAYPQEKGYTRITEYKKLPVQDRPGTSYAVEYPLPYREGEKLEPYYPVLTKESQTQFARYQALADRIPNLIRCGRLADFKYYNMDQALERALETVKNYNRGTALDPADGRSLNLSLKRHQ
ncbi:UDP-galactopyranose mutase [Pseudoflavonifractor sp. 524-17]|uniref:UDP-galactopyranose mutase n=1 Tax=Pseudoflavonifractor sp. 524-17 TaxID=2304577 RepID=UPI00137AF3EE|nr:UDP-galactopyranose mutase [Pseudoflavonifractor sp. 524-17]NCE65311.1 UDP-galactopyranose mutase [Pseudoflavonifractor sp. 524-17]